MLRDCVPGLQNAAWFSFWGDLHPLPPRNYSIHTHMRAHHASYQGTKGHLPHGEYGQTRLPRARFHLAALVFTWCVRICEQRLLNIWQKHTRHTYLRAKTATRHQYDMAKRYIDLHKRLRSMVQREQDFLHATRITHSTCCHNSGSVYGYTITHSYQQKETMHAHNKNSTANTVPPPPVQEPVMFDRGTRGRFLRTLSPQNLTPCV